MRVSPRLLVSFSKLVGYYSEPIPVAFLVFSNFWGGFGAISMRSRRVQVAMLAGKKL